MSRTTLPRLQLEFDVATFVDEIVRKWYATSVRVRQTGTVNLTFDISIDPGTYEFIVEPEDDKFWSLSRLYLSLSKGLKATVYITTCRDLTKCSEDEIFTLDATTEAKETEEPFSITYPGSKDLTQLRIVFENTTDSTLSATLTLKGYEYLDPMPTDPPQQVMKFSYVWSKVVGKGTFRDPIRPYIFDFILNTKKCAVYSADFTEAITILLEPIDLEDKKRIDNEVLKDLAKWFTRKEVDDWLKTKPKTPIDIDNFERRIERAMRVVPFVSALRAGAQIIVKAVGIRELVKPDIKSIRFYMEMRKIK